MSQDPFGLDRLRGATLAAWRANPARLREDANTEEDYARGYYRDRVVAELVQNAADAAIAAGADGRLLLRLTDSELMAANTGAPLDAAGVAAMARMRASAKTYAGPSTTAGHFGVGFAAVRSVSDEIEVHSTSGSLRFSLAHLSAELAAETEPELVEAIARRQGDLPALRMPYPANGQVPEGFATAVVLHLRGPQEVAAVRDQLADVEHLALAFGALAEITVDDGGEIRRVGDLEQRYVVVRREGELPAELRAGRAVEERGRLHWSVTCALPNSPRSATPGSLRAPTPTADPISIPAVMVGSFPLDATRLHVVQGPIGDFLIDQAGAAYAEVVRRAVTGAGQWTLADLVPTGLPAGGIDAQLRESIERALADLPVLASGADWVRPAEALLANPALAAELGSGIVDLAGALGVPGVVDPGPRERALAERLGAQTWQVAASVDLLADRSPADYARLYRQLEPLVRPGGLLAEDLARLPVPLHDGGRHRGPRAVAIVVGVGELADADWSAQVAELAEFGLRLADAQVCDQSCVGLLTALGAQRLDGRGLLGSAPVRAAISAAIGGEALAISAAVAALVRAVDPSPAESLGLQPELSQLPLMSDGEVVPAEDLILPGSVLSGLIEPGELHEADPGLIEQWGTSTLAAIGVRDRPLILDILDPFSANPLTEALPDWLEYVQVFTDQLAGESGLAVVADLDLIRADAWPDLLGELLGEPRGRLALVQRPGGAPSYSRWWMGQYGPQWLSPGSAFALPGAGSSISQALVRRLLPAMPEQLAGVGDDVVALRALGGIDAVQELTDAQWAQLSGGLAEDFAAAPDPCALAIAWWQALAIAAGEHRELDLVAVPAVSADGLAAVECDRVVVADSAMHLQCVAAAPMVVAVGGCASDLAASLDVPLASEELDGELRAHGRKLSVPLELRRALVQMPAEWVCDPELSIDHLPVAWWVDGTGPEAAVWARDEHWLCAALAHACGLWSMRHELRAVSDGNREPDYSDLYW